MVSYITGEKGIELLDECCCIDEAWFHKPVYIHKVVEQWNRHVIIIHFTLGPKKVGVWIIMLRKHAWDWWWHGDIHSISKFNESEINKWSRTPLAEGWNSKLPLLWI